MRSRNSNLRILSTAYAAGKLTKEQYRALRTKQLSALEFGKPLPPLPPGLSAVSIPDNMQSSTNLSARPAGGSKTKLPAIIAVLVVLVIAFGGISYVLLQSAQQQELNELEAMAAELQLQADSETIHRFANLFTSKTKEEQSSLKQSQWAQDLLKKTNKSIAGIEAAKGISGGVSKEVEKRLAALKSLSVLLTSKKVTPKAKPAPQSAETTPTEEAPAKLAPAPVEATEPQDETPTETAPVIEEAVTAPAPQAEEASTPATEPVATPAQTVETPVIDSQTQTEPEPQPDPITPAPSTPTEPSAESTKPLEAEPKPAPAVAPATVQEAAPTPAAEPAATTTEEEIPPEFELIPGASQAPANAEPAPIVEEEKPRESYKIETDPEQDAMDSFFNSTPGY